MKRLIFILLILSGCERIEQETCKTCLYEENGEIKEVFVCGDELQKFENDGRICFKGSIKQ